MGRLPKHWAGCFFFWVRKHLPPHPHHRRGRKGAAHPIVSLYQSACLHSDSYRIRHDTKRLICWQLLIMLYVVMTGNDESISVQRKELCTMAKRALIYARVSTDAQAERGYSIPGQLRACREYASKTGATVIQEFTDEGISGAKTERPGLDRLRAMIVEGQADMVIANDRDRLARNLGFFLLLLEEWHKAGIESTLSTVGRSRIPLKVSCSRACRARLRNTNEQS